VPSRKNKGIVLRFDPVSAQCATLDVSDRGSSAAPRLRTIAGARPPVIPTVPETHGPLRARIPHVEPSAGGWSRRALRCCTVRTGGTAAMAYVATNPDSYLSKKVGTGTCVELVQQATHAPSSAVWRTGDRSADGFIVLEQSLGQTGHYRTIQPTGGFGSATNDADAYFVVE
jgi:hypothetical protein